MQTNNPLHSRQASMEFAPDTRNRIVQDQAGRSRRRRRGGTRRAAWLLLAALFLALPGVARAAAPVLQANQVLWVSNPNTNDALVGLIGLTQTNNVTLPLTYQIIYQSNFPAFKIETYSDYYGLVSVDSPTLLAKSDLFSLRVVVSNGEGASTNEVPVIAPHPFTIPELSSNGVAVGRIVTDNFTNALRFRVDAESTSDARALNALTVLPNGKIQVKNGLALDLESQASYVLGVAVTNLPNPNPVFGQVVVLLSDVNQPPVFADQSFTLPENVTNTFIGTLQARDPENDGLSFQITGLVVGGGSVTNDYFEIRNQAELHLTSLSPPASSVLTVVVTEVRNDGQLPLTNTAKITVEAPKSYSRFGIPLLVPVAGHAGAASNGLPVQALVSGTNQDIYVAGLDANQQPYLQIWPKGFYGDPMPSLALETNFVPTAMALTGTNLFIAGSKTDLNTAAIYHYSTKGLSLNTNYLVLGATNYFNVMDLLEDGGKLYLCGGAGANAGSMRAYWAELDETNLSFTTGSPHWTACGATDMGGAQNVYSVDWGIATALAKQPNLPDIYLAGYDTFTRRWLKSGWALFYAVLAGQDLYEYRYGCVSSFISHFTNGTVVTRETLRSWREQSGQTQGAFVKDMVFGSSGAGDHLYVLEEFLNAEIPEGASSTKRPDGSFSQDVVVKRLTAALQVSSVKNFRVYGEGDVRAESMALIQDGDTNSLVVSGVLPGGKATELNSDQAVRSPGRDSYFALQLRLDGNEMSMGTVWPVVLGQFNYKPAGGLAPPPLRSGHTKLDASPSPRTYSSMVVPYPSKNGFLLAGNLGSGVLSISQNRNENSVVTAEGKNAGFMTIIKNDGKFEEPMLLEVVSEFGLSEAHVRPFSGRQMAVPGDTYTVQVLSPIYIRTNGSYIGDFDYPATEQQIKDEAVTRYICTGYTVANGGPSGNSSSYTFTFEKNTRITFHWTVEHALEIRSDLAGTGALPGGGGYLRDTVNNLGLTSLAAGNPSPEVKKHWVKKDELVIANIDGSTLDLSEYGIRYVVTGYVAEGSAIISTNSSKPANQIVPFPAVELRQQVPQFPMRAPARITYLWGVEHRVQVSTTTLESQDWPGIKFVPDPAKDRTGVGEFWFPRGTHLIIGARDIDNSLQGALLATGDLADKKIDRAFLYYPTNAFEIERDGNRIGYMGAHVDRLLRGTTVAWEYGDKRYLQTVRIGEPVDVLLAAGQTNLVKINTNKAPVVQLLESPSGSATTDVCEWDQVAYRSYPLRPGRFLLHYESRNNTNIALILEITSELSLNHYRHLVHPEMPPVHLDPDPADNLAFLKLAFTTNALVNGSDFVCTNRDLSVLLFSRSDSNAIPYQPATGNRLKETLFVRVVATTPWDEQPGGFDLQHPPVPRATYIGTKLTSPLDTARIDTGFIVYTNARYNATIYDRTKTADAGPIIPVNRQFRTNDLTHDLLMIWYERRDAILWPYTTERFDPQWPLALDPAALPDPLPDVETMAAGGNQYLRRIVVASRLGSEGKDHALRNQLSFALPRYEQVSIYNQPLTKRPGYNPNEEHAVAAPSFKFLDQPNPPPTAYALRNNLNQTNQTESSYTSDSYVLVQYLDHGTNGGPGEFKMAVYAIELEDDRLQLNPERYTSPISGQEREFPYVFHYSMQAGEPVQPPYPLALVIGLAPCSETRGTNLSPQRVYWEDHRGQGWAVSAGDFHGTFYYPLPDTFWVPDPTINPPGASFVFQTGGKVSLTGRIPNPVFAPRSSFELNGKSVTFVGSSAESMVVAVNNHSELGGIVSAAVLDTGEVQLWGLRTNWLHLQEGTNSPLRIAGLLLSTNASTTVLPTPAVRYTATWPEPLPVLKAGETLTFAGGEYKADYPSAEGLPGVIGWAAGEVIFDSLNPLMDSKAAFSNYTARLISPLEERYVELTAAQADKLVQLIQPSTGVTRAKGTRWQFTDLPASLGRRIFYEPLNRRLILKGFVNDKTLGDTTLTAAPPPVYVLEPNILTPAERDTLSELGPLANVQEWKDAIIGLYDVSRNPNDLHYSAGSDDASAFYAGLELAVEQLDNQDHKTNGSPVTIPYNARLQKGLGPGMALVPSPAVLDPNSVFTNGYVTLVENNNPDVGGPITLFIIKVSPEYRYRGAVKTILSDNVFDEKVTLRHSGDFGANAGDIAYQWFYREEDGTEALLPPGGPWRIFPDTSDNPTRGSGMYQINLEGTGGLLLADNLFFVRYRHLNDVPPAGPNSTDWAGTDWETYGKFKHDSGQITKVGTEWAGAANSPTVDGVYEPQLVMGWIKRVLDRVNPYEARISDFRNQSAPVTYASMLQELGRRYEGPVALNSDKNVIENVGLIELYQTILDRGMDLSINLSSPITTPGINTALQLAATRLSDFYTVLGNEAYADAQDPTIAYGDTQMDFATDYGNIASSMFCFQNQVASLLDEELCLLRGVPESYGRPVYNRLFWNFTKSLGEVAYTVNYDITDYNRDGFVDESDAMALYPQGHGDAWGHYLTALKSHYRLLRHPYYNWVSRAEQYNLLDFVLNVDYLDERRFAEAAAARAKTGAEIVNLTYRSRYVEDPDGQWQGYTDIDSDRAWGVDGWARRAGQGALFDWITANAIIPSKDTNLQHNALQKIDRTTVTAIQTLASELGEIQSQYDNANNGLNPTGLASDVVPFDIDVTFNAVGSCATIGSQAVQGMGHFSQIYERARAAVNNARSVYDNTSFMQARLRQVKESADSFRQDVIEQDLDFRNRLIEIFGTPYEGQIGTGKTYPAGYYGPDLMLWMYVDVNDVSSQTVPSSSVNTTQWVEGFRTEIQDSSYGSANTSEDFVQRVSQWFSGDLATVTNVDVDSLNLEGNKVLVLTNLPVTPSGYTFQAPANWGRRASPGELQLTTCEMVQAQADLSLAVADYSVLVRRIDDMVDLIQTKHGVAARDLWIRKTQEATFTSFNGVKMGLRVAAATFEIAGEEAQDSILALMEGTPKNSPTIGLANSAGDFMGWLRAALKRLAAFAENSGKNVAVGLGRTIEVLDDTRGIIEIVDARKMEEANQSYELREKLKELAQALRDELPLRLETFKRMEALRQVSDRYRQTLEGGRRLLDQRQVFNIRSAGVAQRLRYQDMAFRVFRSDALQKYRAAFDLAARYTYMAAKAFDYETNLSPDDRGSAMPLLTDVVHARMLGSAPGGEPAAGAGLAGVLATLRDNWSVLCGRMSFNNAQYEQELISLRSELFRIPSDAANDALWRQTIKKYRVDDLWQVPEFRRYCRPPAPRSAGPLPGLVIPFGTEIVYGRNVFGWPLGPGDHAYDPSVFATKVQSAAIYLNNYQGVDLAATPRVYLVPAGLDIMTIPTSPELETREWTVVDQAIPVPYKTGTNDLSDPAWIPSFDGLPETLGDIRRFSSFLAKTTESDIASDALSYDTRLIGRSVWNTRWLLIIPGGHLLADADEGLDTLLEGAWVPGDPNARDGNGIKDIKLLFNTYGYSGN